MTGNTSVREAAAETTMVPFGAAVAAGAAADAPAPRSAVAATVAAAAPVMSVRVNFMSLPPVRR